MPAPFFSPPGSVLFFLGAAIWAAIGIPLWLFVFRGRISLPSLLPPLIWQVHEMVFGFAAATVAGFLLTAIPNWTDVCFYKAGL